MAEACGKLTGRPGIAMVTRGPGASNAAIGMHTAAQDSSPMILFVGQVGGDFADREAFQEIDYRRMYGSIAKWVAQIDRAERIPEYVARAFRTRDGGSAGPGRARAARGHADEPCERDRCGAVRAAGRRAGERGCRGRARNDRRRAPAARPRRRTAMDRRGLRRSQGIRRSATRCPWHADSAARTCSTIATRTTQEMSASASTRSSRRAFATPTFSSSSANDSERWSRADTR